MIDWNISRSMRDHHFILLHKTELGLEECGIRPPATPYRGHYGCLCTEVKPRDATEHFTILGDEYHEVLEAGEIYFLFWPGAELPLWSQSTNYEHTSMKDCRATMHSHPRAILPASNCIEFTVYEENEPWPEREENERRYGFGTANSLEKDWRDTKDIPYEHKYSRKPAPDFLTEADREPGAPVFTRKIEGPSVSGENRSCKVTVTTTYETLGGGVDAKPITFLDNQACRPWSSPADDFFSLLPGSDNGSTCLETEPGYYLGRLDADDHFQPFTPDDEVSEFIVGQSNEWDDLEFHTLYPGQSLTYTAEPYFDNTYEEDLIVGETYTFRFNGKKLRWWDWGTLEEHKGKKISGFDQGPKIVIPSVSHSFTIIE